LYGGGGDVCRLKHRGPVRLKGHAERDILSLAGTDDTLNIRVVHVALAAGHQSTASIWTLGQPSHSAIVVSKIRKPSAQMKFRERVFATTRWLRGNRIRLGTPNRGSTRDYRPRIWAAEHTNLAPWNMICARG
jgi:hypothetical protein